MEMGWVCSCVVVMLSRFYLLLLHRSALSQFLMPMFEDSQVRLRESVANLSNQDVCVRSSVMRLHLID
jgi:hypothetical protein